MLNSWLMQSILIPAIVTAKIVPVCPSQSLTLAAGCPGKVYLCLNKGARSREGWFGKLPYRLSHLLLNLPAVKAWDAYFSHPFSVNSCSSKVFCLFDCLFDVQQPLAFIWCYGLFYCLFPFSYSCMYSYSFLHYAMNWWNFWDSELQGIWCTF